MTLPREVRLYPLWLLAGVSASFGLAFLLPHLAVSLGGGVLLVTPALLALALLRPVAERAFWVESATLTLFMVPALWAGIGGIAGVHLVAGLSAVVAGLLFWSLRGTWLREGGRSTATSLALCGVALMAWAAYAPLSTQIDAARRSTPTVSPAQARTAHAATTVEVNADAYTRRIEAEQASATARWGAYDRQMEAVRLQASRAIDTYDRLIDTAGNAAAVERLVQARAGIERQAVRTLDTLARQQEQAKAQSDGRIDRLLEEQARAEAEEATPQL